MLKGDLGRGTGRNLNVCKPNCDIVAARASSSILLCQSVNKPSDNYNLLYLVKYHEGNIKVW